MNSIAHSVELSLNAYIGQLNESLINNLRNAIHNNFCTITKNDKVQLDYFKYYDYYQKMIQLIIPCLSFEDKKSPHFPILSILFTYPNAKVNNIHDYIKYKLGMSITKENTANYFSHM